MSSVDEVLERVDGLYVTPGGHVLHREAGCNRVGPSARRVDPDDRDPEPSDLCALCFPEASQKQSPRSVDVDLLDRVRDNLGISSETTTRDRENVQSKG